MNLYIGNLNYTVKEQELQELFQQVGEVSSVKIITDKFTGRSRGFAFVEMPNDAEAKTAIESLNGRSLKERELSVTEAQPRTEGGGNRGGGFNRDRGNGGDRGGNGGYNKRY
ncbi:MAG: RNA-binding protein [Chitinophagales bacterium]|jgi:RNA recognition motif-containing protein|nr:RNA-binding protein [Chitinophagales bacterium]